MNRLEDAETGKVLLPEAYGPISEKRIEQAKQAGFTINVHFIDNLAKFLGNDVWNKVDRLQISLP